MNLETEKYTDYIKKIPQSGKHILAQQTEDQMVVYQAFNPLTAQFVVENQYFGGERYSFARMSWIKPNFLWMMYRCGWAKKDNQKSVLAIWIKKAHFESILKEAVHSSFQQEIYGNRDSWKEALANKEVRLQWDPDHDPHGNKQERRAIQLGLKGKTLRTFGKEMILKIEDVTDFVREQKSVLDAKNIQDLMVPAERIYQPMDQLLYSQIGIDRDNFEFENNL